MENKLMNNIIKYYIEELKENNGVTEEEASEMLNYALQNGDVEQLIFQCIDNNLNEIF